MDLYIPLIALGVLAFGFAAFSVVMASLTGPKRWNRARLDAYECGIEPTPQPVGGGRFPIKYYVTAMLFIIFDIEIIFLYPWAVRYRDLGVFGLVEVIVFAVAIFVSFVYLISNGALEWGPRRRDRAVTPLVSPERTTRSTIRIVGLEGREPHDVDEVAV